MLNRGKLKVPTSTQVFEPSSRPNYCKHWGSSFLSRTVAVLLGRGGVPFAENWFEPMNLRTMGTLWGHLFGVGKAKECGPNVKC